MARNQILSFLESDFKSFNEDLQKLPNEKMNRSILAHDNNYSEGILVKIDSDFVQNVSKNIENFQKHAKDIFLSDKKSSTQITKTTKSTQPAQVCVYDFKKLDKSEEACVVEQDV